MADSRETRRQELARMLLQKARQDLALVVSVADSIIEKPVQSSSQSEDDDWPTG